jgi:Spy/CpxP family protein refolding chaperone
MLMNLFPIARRSAAAMALLWSPRTLIPEFSTPVPSLPLLTQLNLTSIQQQALHTIHLNTKAQLKEAVTPKQNQVFKSTLLQSRNLLIAIAAMQLTLEEQQNLVDIHRSFCKQIEEILTPTQKQYWDQQIDSQLQTRGSMKVLSSKVERDRLTPLR